MQQMQQLLKAIRATDVTEAVHEKPYPAILPTRSELSQAGRTVLITGGGGTLGLAVGKSFIRAQAANVIITGRRAAVLESAVSELEKEATSTKSSTKVSAETCDMSDVGSIQALWQKLKGDGTTIEVFINNAASFSDQNSMLALGAEEIWSHVDTNTKGPLFFADQFCKQASCKQKFIVNVTSAVIHGSEIPEVYERAPYVLSKTAAALYFQLLSQNIKSSEVQITIMEPGLLFNDSWKAAGCLPEWFNDPELPADIAVWLASKEAEFLHGRFIWSSWDVDELRTGELRKRLDREFNFLRVSVCGLKGGMLA